MNHPNLNEIMKDSHRMSGKEMTAKYEFNAVREMDEWFDKNVMRPLEVRHYEDEWTDEEIEARYDSQISDDYDLNTCHEQ